MNQLEFIVTGNKLAVQKLPVTTSGSAYFDRCKFSFDSQWDSLQKTAVFICGTSEEYTASLLGGVCLIPKECLQKSGILKIGVVGVGDDGTVISTNIAVHKIIVGANESVNISCYENDGSFDDVGFDSENEFTAEQELSVWANDVYNCNESDIGSLDSNALKALDENYLTSIFKELSQEYPDYVKESSAGTDSYGKEISVFEFIGKEFDRTIFITANHTHGTYLTSAVLGAFFKALCRKNAEDVNLNFLYNKVKFVVIPAAAPTAYENESGLNAENVNISHNYPYKWDVCTDENKGSSAASEAETTAVMQTLDNVSGENIVAAFDFLSKSISAEKYVFYPPHKSTDEKLLLRTAGKFDCIHTSGDGPSATILAPDNSPSFANFAAERYEISSCCVVWNDDGTVSSAVRYCEFIGNLFLSFAKKCRAMGEKEISSFTKHICWRSSSESDTVILGESILPIYISSFLFKPNFSYNIVMNGYVILKSESGATVTIRPILYQQNVSNADLAARRLADDFDVSIPIPAGVSVIPLNAVLYATAACDDADGNFAQKAGSIIAAGCTDGSAQMIGFSYTLFAVPCGAQECTQVLVPNGLASDFNEDNKIPVFTKKYPIE